MHVLAERERNLLNSHDVRKAENHHIQNFVQIGCSPIIEDYSATATSKQDAVQWPNVLKASLSAKIYSWNCVSEVIYTKSRIAI